MQKKLLSQSLYFALGEAAYIGLVVTFINNASRVFGEKDNALSGVVFLMLLVFSVALSGALVFGKPVLLYLEGKKKEAIHFFGFTLGWMFILWVVVLIGMTFLR